MSGYQSTLGHEFVGVVESCTDEKWQGQRVVGEINCLCEAFHHSDPVRVRNHAPKRVVLGIINKDGCMSEYITLPTQNLHLVPSSLSDQEACFAEPLAAACRIAEQQVHMLGGLTSSAQMSCYLSLTVCSHESRQVTGCCLSPANLALQ